MLSCELISVAMRLYKAAVRPLKLMLRDSASGELFGKFLMHKTKQTVLNQVMLQPADKHRINACQE
ncbi:hypothetical protein Hanom_Chr03g00255681 [Helianthus anomalus]